MTDEGAKILAAAIEKLAAALANGIHIHQHAPVQFFPGSNIPNTPARTGDPMMPPYVVTCETGKLTT